jgi:hypothetical protein
MKDINFKGISSDLPNIVQLYEYSRLLDKKSWTLVEMVKRIYPDEQFDKVKVSEQFKQLLETLRSKGAVNFNDDFNDIILDKIKLCLLTTNPEMNKEELTKRSQDPSEDCYKRKLF